MGVWIRSPALEPTETVVWSRAANRTQSAQRAVGGRLFLTTSRLLFEPNRVDAATGGASWSAPLSDVQTVGTTAPDGNPRSGGLRTRLRVDLANGQAELFVVNQLADVVRLIGQAVGEAS